MMAYEYMGRTLDQWRAIGQGKLAAQRARIMLYMDLYDGDPVGTTLSGESRQLFKRLLQEARTNWCELVVNAVAERLGVQWFDFGDNATNDLVWQIWQASSMDADGEMSQTDALVCGLSPVAVWPDEDNPTGVRIHIEHAMETALIFEPGSQRKVIAAFKSFGQLRGVTLGDPERVDVLILPDYVITWHGAEATDEPNTTGIVPYVQLMPSPQTYRHPRSELHSAASIQKRINTTIYNRLVASDFGAFRQITATGVQMKRQQVTAPDGTSGVILEAPFNVGADRLLLSESPDAKFGAIPEATLDGYLNAVEADVQHLAAITQTPPHYLLGKVANISGEALKAAESGLVSKVRRRAAHIGEGWEEVMRLALGFLGNPATVNYQAEVMWHDFETRSEGELVDSLVKMASIGVPRSELWSRWGATPPQVRRWSELADAITSNEEIIV